MADEGYDVEVLQDISSDLYCVICLKLMRNPVQFKCGHGMCHGCFKSLLKKAKQRTHEIQCPQCRELVRESQIFSNVMLHRLILSMQVHCSYANDGCFWIGELSEFDEHLVVCGKSSKKKQQSSENVYLQNQQVKREIPETLQNSLLLGVIESLTSLHDKMDNIDEKLILPISQPTSPIRVKNLSKVESKKHKKKSSVSLLRRETQTMLQKYGDIFLVTKYMLPALILIFLFIYMFTASIFSSFENAKIDELVELNKPLSYGCSQCTNSEANKEIEAMLDQLLIQTKSQSESFFQFVSYNMKYRLFDMQTTESLVASEIPNFYIEQNRTIMELQKRFNYFMEQSRLEINTNISHYDNRALNTLSVDNVESLMQMAQPIFSSLRKKIFEDINFAEYQAHRTAEHIYKTVRSKFWSIRQKADFSAKELFKDNIYASHLKSNKKLLEELRDNVTHSYKMVDKDRFLTVVDHDFTMLKLKYEHTLKSYYKNITRAVTQEQRFFNLMHQVQNVDLQNGRFIWKINATLLTEIEDDFTLESNQFQTGSTGNGMLFLYKDQARKGYFKLTFIQIIANPITIAVSVMSQLRPEVLLCFEAETGLLPKIKENAKVVKYFTMPMNMTELNEKGFVQKNKMFVRCMTEDRRIKM